jgi:hypothetical protein
MIESRKSQYSYGIIDSPPYDSTVHDEKDRFWDSVDAIDRANQIEWIVKKVVILYTHFRSYLCDLLVSIEFSS